MHVTRQRRTTPEGRTGLRGRSGRRLRIVAVGTAAALVAGAGMAYAGTDVFGHNEVGTQYKNGLQVSDDQIIAPLGQRLLTKFGKFMGSAVSPDGQFLAASSADKGVVLQMFDVKSYKLVWTVGSASGVSQKLADGTVGQEGPTFSPDGKVVWLAQNDELTRFPVNADGSLGTATSFPLPAVDGASALPGKSVYSADGSTLYVPLNGQNSVVAINPDDGTIEHTWKVGVAPRELALVNGKLYVSDEGGRTAQSGDTTLDSYGAPVPSDPYLGTSTTGAVSVIDPADTSAAVRTIAVGLHPTALYVNRGVLFVANTNSDTVSVIDTTKNQVVQTIATQPWPASQVGYQPTSMTMTNDGHLLVTLGRANAVAVYRYHFADPRSPVNYVGLLPTDYYPATIALAGGKVVVTNTRGIDARGPELTYNKGPGTAPAVGHGTHSTTATLTRFTLPNDQQIAKDTATVFAQNGWGKNDVATARKATAKPVAVPVRLGDPSTIKHVFLLVKENRSYDQVYGDMRRGNGDRSLAQFGENVTPNQHALARQFGLYDNTYDIGTNSAEGHNWLMQGDNPEYTESSAGSYTRSYDTEEDVLGHQRSGFLWTAAESAGATARNYGEFEYTEGKPAGSTWQQYYCAAKSTDNGGDPSQLTTPALAGNYGSVIPSLNAIADHLSPPFDTSIPDQYRYEIWKQDFEKNGPQNFNMMWLSSDHTGGPPTPEAQVADGDLAVGKIVDTISHSKYWKSSAIFVVEDDSQDGPDHVDGHRAPIQVISPWAQHDKVDSTYYTQINMVRTIEQILGAQPLNQKLAAAAPMYGAFTNRPDYTPFTAVRNRVPLTEGVSPAPDCGTDTLGTKGAAARKLDVREQRKVAVPAAMKKLAAQWAAWATHQRFTGNTAVPDFADPQQMNRYTWYRAHEWAKPYPGDSRFYTPATVPGGYLPSSDPQ